MLCEYDVVTTVLVVRYGWVAEEIGAGGVDGDDEGGTNGDDEGMVVGRIVARPDDVTVPVNVPEVAVIVVEGTGVNVATVIIEVGSFDEDGAAELFGVTVVEIVPVTVL